MDLEDLRRFALSLPEATEEPHFTSSSFRIRGKIFATLPPDGEYLHVFVDEQERELAIVQDPTSYEKLWWGKKVVGVRVFLQRAETVDVTRLVTSAWERKAPKALLKSLIP